MRTINYAKLSWVLALAALGGFHLTTHAESGGYRTDYYQRGSGGNSGWSSRSYNDTFRQGYTLNERWGHDRSFRYDRGGWHQERPIYRGGELVGSRELGRQWDRESGHNREWQHRSGNRYGNETSRWRATGGGREWGSGSGRWSGSGWGAPLGEFQSNWGSRGYGPYGWDD